MAKGQNDISPQQAAAALAWLSEMGADEIIGDLPVDRTAMPHAAGVAERRADPEPPRPAMRPALPVSAAHAGEDARALAAACSTLSDIARALETFDACPLKKTATKLCFADGNEDAFVMLIGEAPGRDEDLQGKPFVGRSGQLLDRMLKAIGLARSAADPEGAVYISNTIFWRPPGNRTPTEAETAMCLPFLERAIEIKQPHVIVCLGATPTQRLTGRTEGILKLRGQWLETRISGRTIPLLPTLHPAYLLRQPGQKRLAWRDMLLLRQALDAH